MKRPGFRRTSVGGRRSAEGGTQDSNVSGAPFSQAQILHLMRSEFGRARRHGYPLSCVLIRPDRLRSLVEMHGRELRDAVRGALGPLVAESTRDHDYVGLLGDDRYLLLLPHTSGEAAVAVADRIRRKFFDLEFDVDGHTLPISLSLGVAATDASETLFFDTLVSQAEIALEWAESDGGDATRQFRRDRFADPSDSEEE